MANNCHIISEIGFLHHKSNIIFQFVNVKMLVPLLLIHHSVSEYFSYGNRLHSLICIYYLSISISWNTMKIFHRRFVAELNANIAFDGTRMRKEWRSLQQKTVILMLFDIYLNKMRCWSFIFRPRLHWRMSCHDRITKWGIIPFQSRIKDDYFLY